jgi:XapX domain-containing protein
MKPLIVALAVGLLVGALYGLLNVRSPAPPYVALLGLLGILLGEHGVQAVRHHLTPPSAVAPHAQAQAPKDPSR